MAKKIEEMLEKHRKLKIQLSEIKDEEMELRVEIVDLLGDKSVGTHDFTEYDGFTVKLVNKLGYKIDKSFSRDKLTARELECVRFKPEINLTQYKLADTPNLDEFVTVSQSAPTLTVELV